MTKNCTVPTRIQCRPIEMKQKDPLSSSNHITVSTNPTSSQSRPPLIHSIKFPSLYIRISQHPQPVK